MDLQDNTPVGDRATGLKWVSIYGQGDIDRPLWEDSRGLGQRVFFYSQAFCDGPAPATGQQIADPFVALGDADRRPDLSLAAGVSILLGAWEGATLSKTTICRFCG